jgi:hypothetical protein
VNIPLPEAEVAQVVGDVTQNGIIRGSKEYEKDEYIKNAEAVKETKVFPAWTDPGKVFYKVRTQAIDPRNFKDTNDVGTLAVRYVVQPDGDKNTVLRIDAIFVEEFKHSTHLSNGSVEGSEYKSIQDRLDQIELMKKEAAEAESERQAKVASKNFEATSNPPAVANTTPSPSAAAETVAALSKEEPSRQIGPRPGQSMEEYAAELRRQVERRVKFPGAPLKSAPYHSASTMKSLASGTEVLVVISTQYWFGVETRDGAHGWVTRAELEEVQ